MATKLASYGFINAKLRTRLSKILEDPEMTALLRADSAAEVVSLLEPTDYQEAAKTFVDTADIRLTEAAIFEAEVAFFTDVVDKISGPPGNFVAALLLRYEVETLKRALRIWFEKHVKQRDVTGEIDYLYDGFPRLRVKEIIEAKTLVEVSELLARTPYSKALNKAAQTEISRWGLFSLETDLDRLFFTTLSERMHNLSKTDRKIAGKIIGVEIDLENLERVVRFKDLYGFSHEQLMDYLIPSGALLKKPDMKGESSEIIKSYVTGHYRGLTPLLESLGREKYSNLILLEAVLNEVLAVEVKRALLGYPFTIGIILAYLFLKRREARRIVRILNAKAYGIDEERLRDLP